MMGNVIESRMMADLEGEFLVFVIELQIHKLRSFRKWYPAVRGMNAMLAGNRSTSGRTEVCYDGGSHVAGRSAVIGITI